MPVRKADLQIRSVVIGKDAHVRSSKVVQGDYWGSGYDERANDDLDSYGLPAGTYRVSFYPSGADSGSDAIVHLKVEKKVGNKFVRVDLKAQKPRLVFSNMSKLYPRSAQREGLSPEVLLAEVKGMCLGYVEPKTSKGPWRAWDFYHEASWTPYKFKTREEAAEYLWKTGSMRGTYAEK